MTKTMEMTDEGIEYQVVRRRIKYPRLEFKTGRLVVVFPESGQNYVQLVKKYQRWITAKTEYINKALKNVSKKKLVLNRTPMEFKTLADELVFVYSKELRVKPSKIFIRNMRSKWASMSANRNLTLNSLLKHLPHDLVAYVIYHELVHIIERRHNTRFWSIIRRKYKNPEKFETMLFEYWFLLKRVNLIPSLLDQK
jgi:predicted metal-dependent hydrolase